LEKPQTSTDKHRQALNSKCKHRQASNHIVWFKLPTCKQAVKLFCACMLVVACVCFPVLSRACLCLYFKWKKHRQAQTSTDKHW
jgi:hypothetical protein